jgi:hypothetical protein
MYCNALKFPFVGGLGIPGEYPLLNHCIVVQSQLPMNLLSNLVNTY